MLISNSDTRSQNVHRNDSLTEARNTIFSWVNFTEGIKK